MFIFVVGLNHKSAPVEVREKLSFTEAQLSEALHKLQGMAGIEGCCILSTCNRTEIYGASTDMEKGMTAVKRFVLEWGQLQPQDFSKYFYVHTLYDAIRHLFRVASGLDSMVLGETQILGQVRTAYQRSCNEDCSNGIVNTWFQQAITVGKRVRTETGIDQHPVSISYTAVELAEQVLGGLKGRTAMVLGAGKMSVLTLKHLVAEGVDKIIIANRSVEKAEELAKSCGGEAISFADVNHRLEEADILISCTAATHYVIRKSMVEQVMDRRGGKPVFFFDIAVPRDIDPEVAQVPGTHLYDIDAMQHVIDRNLAERRKCAAEAEIIIEHEINQFMRWLNSLFVIPTIVGLKNKGNQIKEKELDRALCKLKHLSEKEKKLVGSLASSIVNQLLHDPITQLRHYAASPEGHLYSEILQNLFCLDVPGQRQKHVVVHYPAVEQRQNRA
ncbi:glutamyl-tRNA reductase [Heliobacillus mobilis]|uniref:Glutamyl-tRNA reductase n=2 Tax=Heliobacterium mobile TaxID=28064 RepID=HEM1_HELMO|nr:glutamyl-tRNA reductase [Heliobacterium mobile]Q9ZGG6.1 RecName: Full=Glutamyl-tRNA reductase; Short=GluTR [Heliobacterium mobile]AAC84013.1 glutamyl tRNA reductase HemA [Heliobacterium mobile]MTV48479.1 glutamyl-tRNA reductase [Heliobacterium mobile]